MRHHQIFDADYTYSLGTVAAALVAFEMSGYLSSVSSLAQGKKQAAGVPLTSLMQIEQRKGRPTPVIGKALVDLDGAPFAAPRGCARAMGHRGCLPLSRADPVLRHSRNHECDHRNVAIGVGGAKLVARRVYSTGPDGVTVNRGGATGEATIRVRDVDSHDLRVRREKSGRKGKTVTTASPFYLEKAKLTELAKRLKKSIGSGGAVKSDVDRSGEPCFRVELQGDHVDRLVDVLAKEGFAAKRAGG